jgi:hypothetical protein
MLLCPRGSFVLCSSEAYSAGRFGLLGTRHSVNFSLTYVDLSQRCRRSGRNSGVGVVAAYACSYRVLRDHRLHKLPSAKFKAIFLLFREDHTR